MTKLTLQDIRFAAEGRVLLGPITLEWPKGGLTAIMGSNGAGKSLLLSLCHGHLAPKSGSVMWDDQPAITTKRHRGFVFQKPVVLRRSVADNLRFALQVESGAKSQWNDRITTALAHADLAHKATAPASTLSGGEMQRLALARAMITNPQALLLDEPASNLDPAATRRLEDMIKDVSQNGVQVLLATHDLGQAKRLAERVIFMSEGQILEHGPAVEFFDGPQTVNAQNYLEGIL